MTAMVIQHNKLRDDKVEALLKQGDEMKAVLDLLKSDLEPKLLRLEEQVNSNADFRVRREA